MLPLIHRSPSGDWKKWSVFGLLIVSLCINLIFARWGNSEAQKFKLRERGSIDHSETPVFSESWVSGDTVPAVHSASVVTLDDHTLLATWYGGTREGHRDVQLFTSRFDFESNEWTPERAVIDAKQAQSELDRYIRKLGNPVIAQHPNGDLWMLYVSVSLGGWSTSNLNLSISKDNGATWKPSRRLIASPFFNISNLIRAKPIFYEDGNAVLPAYHELASKFGEALVLDNEGNVIDKSRIDHHSPILQPHFQAVSQTSAIAFLRNKCTEKKFMLRSVSHDSGSTWSNPVETVIPNADSGFAIVALANGDLLTAFNDTHSGRTNLALAISSDNGRNWKRIVELEKATTSIDGSENLYEYPSFSYDHNGIVHLLYTFNRKRIKHMAFNEAWIRKEAM